MKKLTTLLTALAVISLFGTAFAQLDIGGDIKVLGFWEDNVTDADDDADDQEAFLRTETHLWFQADLSDNVTTKISVETDRVWSQDDAEGGQNDLDVFLEEAWIQMMYLYDSAFSVKLGRQFVEFGDGFIVGDSNPFSEETVADKGEWEVDPFDAVLVWYDGDDWILNLMGAKVVESGIGNDDTDVYGAYFSYSGAEEMVFDLYGFMAKIKSDVFGIDDADVYWVGARIAGTMVEGLSYKLEGTYEFGEAEDGDVDISAWAVEAGAKYMFDAEYNPWVGLTYVYLSGDDEPGDDDWEPFLAPFQNRVYGEIADPTVNGFGHDDDLTGGAHIFNLAGGFDVNEDVAVNLKYYYLMAAEDDVYGGEDEIGHEFDAYLDYQFSEETTATLAAGFAIPGDAVKEVFGTDDEAFFLRGAVKVEF